MMKILTVFYSRTGTTKGIGEYIANELKCDIEEIYDTQKRSGIIGFLRSGYQATRAKLTVLKPISKNPIDFDLIIIGTPIWNRHVSTPIRTYLFENGSKFKDIAFFCTEGSKGGVRAFTEMEKICNKTPKVRLEITRKEIKKGLHNTKLKDFIVDIQKT